MFAVVASFAIAADAQTGAAQTPRTDTLRVTNGEVLDSIVLGNRVIVVGTFTQVENVGGNSIDQPYIAAYNANTGQFDSSFRPDVNNFVNAIATDGNNVYITGQFSTVDGENHRRIAKLNSNGSVNSNFDTSMGSTPNTLDVANGKVYIGGPFTTVNGQAREAFAAVDANNGDLDSTTNFDFADVATNGGVTVRWLEVSPNNNFLFVSHSARLIDGQIRTGIARFDVSANSTNLSSWQTTHFEDELDRLPAGIRPRRLAISPDGSYVVQVSSGNDIPPTNDVAVRFPTSGGANVQAAWVSRHFDTVLGVAINNEVVFVGGHFQFQEAPGSDNPFPGDPDTTFGFGGNQGPVILGSQVVQREQIGALDPSTGKSVDWNPGSDSFIGVQSLTWDDQYGLLVGHDGNRLGGVNGIGRHAIFPTGNTPTPDPTPDPDPTPNPGNGDCTVSFNGNTATVTFNGDLGTSLQIRRNGSWAATANGNTATINASPGDTITARLRGPQYQDPFQDIACTTAGGGTPNPDPTPDPDPTPNPGAITTTIAFPANGGVLQGGPVTLTGEATAPDGIRRVRVTIQRVATGEYLTEDGSFTSDFAALDDDLNTTATSATWEIPINLQFAGDYNITARTFDTNGVRNTTVRSTFVVGVLDNSPPEILVNAPIIDGPFVNFSGSAIDDLGIDEVSFLLQNRVTLEYFRLDGSLGEAQRHTATLSNPGATFTNWSQTITGLPAGEWRVTIDAFDNTDQRDRRGRNFIVE